MAATLSDSAILDALRPIVDPDFGKSIVDLGFVKNIQVSGGDISFTIELTTPACPVKAEFEKAARSRSRIQGGSLWRLWQSALRPRARDLVLANT